MGLFGKIGTGLGKLGKIALKAAPVAAAFIPGVGPLAAGAIGAGSKLLERGVTGKKVFGDGGIKSALLAGGGAAAGSAVLGGKGFKGLPGAYAKLASVGKTIGKPLGKGLADVGKLALNTFKTPQGGLDLGKLGGIGLSAAGLAGARKESNAANDFNANNAKLRQMLMERMLQSPNYNFTR